MDKTSLSRRAYLLNLSSHAIADNMKNGSFKSVYRGQGVDFCGVRDYLPGDDVRNIDWNVTARMGKPYVKLFEEERELEVFLIVDKSLSMNTGSSRRSRVDAAVECASLFALAANNMNSPVGAVVFGGKIDFSCAPASGEKHIFTLLSRLEKTDSSDVRGSALDAALVGADKLLRKRTLVIVISDFRTSGWEVPFARLAHKNDVLAIRITDPLDSVLPPVGSVAFEDLETGHSVVLPTSSQSFERTWREYNDRKTELWNKECLRRGGIPFTISTTADCAAEIVRFLSMRVKV